MLSMKSKGYWLVFIILTLNLVFWFASKFYYNDSFNSIFKYLAKISSLTGTLLMSFTLILSIKERWLEYYFGGLDKVYKAHHTLGRWSFTFLVLHPIFLSLIRLPDLGGVLQFFVPSLIDNYYIGHSIGLVALLFMFVLLYLTISSTLNYELWLRTHSLFGLVFFLGIIHILFISADIASYPLFGLWYYFWLALGLISYLWITFVSKVFGKKYEYKVFSKIKIDKTVELNFKPVTNIIKYNPGQFLYTRFLKLGLADQWHPYSIASYEENGNITMGIKALGDHTSILIEQVEEDDKVEFKGPFGNLSEKAMLNNGNKLVMIGAGVGITPMLSIWQYIIKYKNKQTTLVYIASFIEEANFNNNFEDINNKTGIGNNKYWLYLDEKKNFFNIDLLKSKIGDLSNTDFLICGPKRMMDSMVKGLKDAGVSNKNIVVEDFEFGIGKKVWFGHITSVFK
jgi:predicted ferric reductase